MQKNYCFDLNEWRDKQSKLSKGKLCPYCGKILQTQFNYHLMRFHNVTTEDWYCLLHKCEKYQHKCKICQKPLSFEIKHAFYPEYCSLRCSAIGRSQKIGSSFSYTLTIEQRKARHLENDMDYANWQQQQHNKLDQCKSKAGKIGGKTTTQKYGSEFSYSLTKDQQLARGLLTNDDYMQWQQNNKNKLNKHKSKAGHIGGKTVQQLYGCSLPGIGYRSNIIFESGKTFHFDSQCELFNFLTRHYIDNIQLSCMDNDRYLLNETSAFNGSGAYTDLIISSDNQVINYEVHAINDITNIQRKKFCTELNNMVFKLENINDYIFPTGKYIQELSALGFNVQKLYNNLTSVHYNEHHALDIKYTNLSIYFQYD